MAVNMLARSPTVSVTAKPRIGTGPIRGFAVTLTVGLLANMFTAIYMSHRIFEWVLGSRRVETLSI